MLAAVTFAIKYLPLIVAAVTFVQNFADPKLPGAQRKALAVEFVVDALKRLGYTANERTVTVIEWLIDLAVNVLNRFGIFTHDEPADLVEVAAPVAPLVIPAAPSPDAARITQLEEIFARQ